MEIADKLREAIFLSRENLFACLVELEGSKERVHLPSTGRLNTLLFPGQRVFLAAKLSPSRKTKYDLVMVNSKGTLVSVNTRVPEELVYQALRQRDLPQFSDYPIIQRWKTFDKKSRFDFLLSNSITKCFLEVKSVTLVQGGKAAFPDAPTLRGRKHLESLVQAKKKGYEAAILFLIQREDAKSLSPNDKVDHQFGHVLREAQFQGVDLYAYRCQVSLGEINLAEQVPVYL